MIKRTRFALTPIAIAILAMTGQASAQQAAPVAEPDSATPTKPQPTKTAAADPKASNTLETVVVTGFRASLESALNKKREDNGIVDVIKAEDLAKFPDTNLAESLQRIPGVVIDRDGGEGRNITVRGLGLDFTRIRINGMEAMASTGGTDSSGGNNRSRGFDFNVFASELFSSLTVRKSASADVDEGSLGATVDLETARPFDFKGLKASASLQERYNDLSKKTNPRGAFLFTNRFFDDKVGFLISGAYSKRQTLEEGFSSVRWDNGPSVGGFCAPTGVANNPTTSTATTCGPAAQGVPRLVGNATNIAAYNASSSAANFTPRIPRYGRLTNDQERVGVTSSFQFRPWYGTLITADMLYSKVKATRQEDYLESLTFSRTLSQGGKPQTSVLDASYSPSGSLLYGLYNGVDVRAESRYDVFSTTFTQPSLTVEHELSESLKISAKIGRADSKFRNPTQTTTTLDALNVNGYSLDFRGNDRLPQIVYPFDVTKPGGALTIIGIPLVTTGTQPATVANTTTSEIRIRPQGTNNRNDSAKFDLVWEVAPSMFTVKAGGDYKKFSFDTYEFRRVNQSDTIFAPPAGTSVADLTTTLTNFGRGLGIPGGTPTSWVIPNLNAITQAYNIYCNCLQSGPAGGPGDFTLSSITNPNARGNNRSVSETDKGFFLMADFSTKLFSLPVRGNLGARYVKTELLAKGYQAAGGGTEVVVENSYDDLLPSANVAVNLSRDFIVRFAAAKVMTRPQLGFLSPGGSINTVGNLTITSGNPLLKPFRAKTYDTNFEWYIDRDSFLGVGLFYKDIGTYIQRVATSIPFNQTGLPQSLLPANFNGTEVFTVTAPINTSGGALKGYEINYQQAFSFLPGSFKNFGTLLNYTFVKSKINYVVSPTSTTTISDDLTNLSPKSWNATLYYDDKTFSARVSASYRKSFVTLVPGVNNSDVDGKNSSRNVDASISYKVTPNVTLTLEGVNLTDEPNDQFTSRARNNSVAYTHTGREFLAGVRVNF